MFAAGLFACNATETNSPPAVGATNAATSTNVPATFEVKGYHIEGNSVLPPEKFSFLSKYTGKAVNLDRVREAQKQLQLLYRQLGFATISVTLPRQRLTNGMVHFQVVEGWLSEVKVLGNRFFSTNNVLRSLPGLDTNILLNTKWLQPELDQANANPDRQIYPVINPGLDPGTTELTLKVKDRFPLHGHIELDNKATPFTPPLRIDTALQCNNLWQLEHQIGVEYNFSPQEMKNGSDAPNILDAPKVASYSGFYRIPFRSDAGLREEYESLPVDFGYDQVTHQFRLPPATGGPELIIFASRSAADTEPNYGPLTGITTTNTLANVTSQSVQRTLSFSDDLGVRLTLPIDEFNGIKSAFSLGVDYKSYKANSYNTNLSYFDLYSLDSFGNPVLVTNFTIPLAANSVNSLYYIPFSVGWSASRPDSSGNFSFNLNQNLFFSELASARTNFQAVAGNTGAGGTYTSITAGLTREQQLPGNWSLLLRGSGQWASEPLIANEQMALGGTGGVRGYREGEAYGDCGWRAMFDLRAPPIHAGNFPTAAGDIPAYLRCSWFMDYGQTINLAPNTTSGVKEWGTGIGLYLTAGQHFDARVVVAMALHDTPLTRAGDAQAYLAVGFQF